MPPLPDARWIEGIRRGDTATFEAVVRAHYPALFDYAAALTHDPEAAADLVQDVLAGLWADHARFQPATTVRAWLFRAVHNRALNVVRDRRAHPPAPVEAADLLPARSGDPDDALRYRALLDAYHRAVDALPQRRREVFRLSRLYGLSYDEIADHLGLSVHTVRAQIAAALATLRRNLRDFLPE